MDVNGSTVVDTNTLTISTDDADGRLDLNDNDLIVRNTPDLAAITTLIKTALENGGAFDWQGIGIGSTQAHLRNQLAGSFLYGVGVLRNDLSGHVDATDYSLLDSGYVNGRVGWIFGDFDYSGNLDATDYALIDNAYVNQSGTLGPMRSSGTRSNAAEELFGSWKYDLGTAEEMIQRHRKEFGSDYDDALDAIRSGKLGLNRLVWFVVVPTPEERKSRQL
ncbi:hypothetical protein [Fontivita pretiosa]|uniref:hypothetical protein n=1 Tax=Fontivita pretiosa TaxID=2989684 RepID=UPI003D16D691